MTQQTQLPLLSPPTTGPVLYLTCWAWIFARRREGAWPPPQRTGHAYTIMAAPRDFAGGSERGDGAVRVLVPQGDEVELMRALVNLRRSGEALDTDHAAEIHDRYRRALDARWSRADLRPGALVADTLAGPVRVQDGDTLACACSAEEARAGRCHRVHAATWLRVAGWEVRLG